MRQILLILAVVALAGCGESKEEKAAKAAAEWKVIEAAAAAINAAKAAAKVNALEKAIRVDLKKPTGELTKADYEKVTELNIINNQLTELPKGLEKLTQLKKLYLDNNQLTDVKGLENLTQLKTLYLSRNQLTDVKGLEKLTQLETLDLSDNPDLTKAQIDELQKALPKCKIYHNAKE